MFYWTPVDLGLVQRTYTNERVCGAHPAVAVEWADRRSVAVLKAGVEQSADDGLAIATGLLPIWVSEMRR